MRHFYGQVGGTYRWPNSAEGDLLKMTHAALLKWKTENAGLSGALRQEAPMSEQKAHEASPLRQRVGAHLLECRKCKHFKRDVGGGFGLCLWAKTHTELVPQSIAYHGGHRMHGLDVGCNMWADAKLRDARPEAQKGN